MWVGCVVRKRLCLEIRYKSVLGTHLPNQEFRTLAHMYMHAYYDKHFVSTLGKGYIILMEYQYHHRQTLDLPTNED